MTFQPISSESGLRRPLGSPHRRTTLTFQPISSESGLRRWQATAKTLTTAFSTHIQRKRIATRRSGICKLPIRTFQPISSESGLRLRLGIYRRGKNLAFQPISSESGLRRASLMKTSSGTGLFNPYPAKADCDRPITFRAMASSPFQPISSESGLRHWQ